MTLLFTNTETAGFLDVTKLQAAWALFLDKILWGADEVLLFRLVHTT